MRTLGVGDLAQPVSTRASLTDAMKVEVANSSDVLVDLTGFLVSIEYESGADEIVDAATLVFRRLSGTESLAPLMTAAPPVQLGRRFVIWVNPGGGFEEVLRGKITDVDWPLRYGDVTVQCLDQARDASRTWIEEPIEYGSTTGVSLETVMQSVATDNMTAAPTLYFPVPTGAVVQHIEGDAPYGPTEQSVLEAERALAESYGGTIRWRYIDSLGAWRWTVFTPSRTKTVPDYTFTPSDYFDVKQIKLSDADIRNVIEVEYIREGVRESVEVEDAASIALYGRLYAKISEGSDSPVNNATLATALGNAALSDLKDPDVLLEIACRYFWPGEIGVDLYRFTANNVHFSSDQDLAPMKFRHRIAINEAPTSHVLVRGKPSGGVLSWRRRGRSADGLRPLFDFAAFSITNFREGARTATTIPLLWDVAGLTLQELWLFLATKTQPVSGDPWADLVGAPTVRLTPDTTGYTVSIPPTGTLTYGRLVPIGADGAIGNAWDFTVQPNDQTPAITEPWQTIAAGGLTTDVTFTVTDPAGLGGTLSVWTNHDSAEDADSTGAVEGTFAVASTPATVNQLTTFTLTVGGTSTILNDIKVHAGKGKRVFAKFVNSQGVASDVTPIMLKPGKPAVTETGTLTPGIITDVTPFASNISPVQIVAALPGAGSILGHVVFLTTDKRMYRWTGTAWEAVVAEFSGTIDTAQIADAAVTAAKIGALAVEEGKIAAGAVTAAKIGALAVTTAKIAALAVTAAEIGAAAVTTAKIAALAVGTSELAAGAVTAAKITALTITAAELAAGAVTAAKIGAGEVTAGKIAALSIVAGDIAASTITGAKIAANTIAAGNIVALTITAAELAAGSVIAAKIGAGEVTAGKIAALSIVAGDIAANTITAAKIAANTITAAEIAADTITAGQIAAGAISTSELAAGAVTAAKIGAGEVTASKISVTDLSAISAALGTVTSGYIQNSGNTAAIRMSGATTLPSTNYLDFTATGAGLFLKNAGLEITADGKVTAKVVKLSGDGPSPTISGVTGTEYGTGATISIAGKDAAGTITLTTGTVPAGVVGRPNTFCTVTFGTAYASAPYVIVVPISADGAEDVQAPYYGEATTTTFDVKGTAASVAGYSASTIYKWSYMVIG